ncbi:MULTISPECIES: restriction endonuclease [unclassified Streptomyces]|uniref:Lsr2 family DNA-binding protein n=1 Tax=unclassified Streptomyces TaxID=2593676 RepID=UPI0006AF1E3A|nr:MULTISPECIES: restriction endonuclease [unclassified Streptomyces]KOX22887.1 hypothetical protein ADL06_23565 [Streptomyces sp. NRRL F-6491]KOX40108.1 hypothetical protein ADL08_23720 [Streptomyces sp. NRRL F-6492]
MDSPEQQAAEGFPTPLPWLTRAGASPYVPGTPREIVGNLRALLLSVAEDGTIDRPFAWPGAERPIPLRNAVHALGSCGLVTREGRPPRLALTRAARHFLDSGDELHLVAVLHANVRFLGEALAEVGDGITHAGLNEVAGTEYGLSWNSLDQVRRRVYWLRAAGLVEYWTNGRIVPTERGRAFLERLETADRDQLPHRRPPAPEPVELPPLPAPLALALSGADQAALRARKRLLGYVAGGVRMDALARLVNAAVPDITRAGFKAFCAEEFGVLESSAEQTLGTLRALGLLTQVGTDTFAATEYATSCLESDEPVDLVRLLHLHVALLGETLDALENSAPTSALALVLAERYPDIPLTHQDVTRRVALFLETGLAERIGLTVRRTELGAALVRTLPLLRPADSGPADCADAPAAPAGPGTPSAAAADGDRAHHVGSLAAEVVRAAGDSSDHRRFERAVAAAFRALGVDVESHGGPRRTDAVIELWRSPTVRHRIAVEAKTDGAGLVTDQDVRFRRLGEHRARHAAQGTVLVGPGFDARLVREAASEKVALLTARELADALVRHARTPLAPRELAALVTWGEADALERTWGAAERRQETLGLVVHTLWRSGNDPVEVRHTTGALGVNDIWRETRKALETPLDPDETGAALAFLETPFLSGVERQGGGHVITAPPSLIAARLRALAAAVESAGEDGPPGDHSREGTPAPPGRPGPVPPGQTSVPHQQRASTDVPASAVRAWAKARGRAVNERGRLPERLITDYLRARDLE